MNRSVLLVLLAILIIAAGAFLFFHPQKQNIRNIHSTGATVVALGDSLTEGVGASDNQYAWPAVVAQNLGIPITNSGKAGDTTAEGLARIRGDVLLHDPWLVIVFLGGNDINRFSLEETFRNLRRIVEEIQDVGAAVLLIGIRGGTVGDPYKESFERLSREHQTAYIPDFMARIFTTPRFRADDRIHPNDAGYEFIAQKIAPEIERLLKQREDR